MLIKLLILILPWRLKRYFLNKLFKYEIHPKANIGLAWVYPKKLIMDEGSIIDHFTVAIHLNKIEIGKDAIIGRSNWITGFPKGTDSKHFKHQSDRSPELLLGDFSAITKRHHIDCTNTIKIGRFVTIAGYQSQLLTHSINLTENYQDSAPINIGDYAFVGTNSVILGGSTLPSYSVLGAKSLLNKVFTTEWTLYAGVPASPIKDIPKNAKYFTRTEGFIY
ncbi:acyltransferase [Spirosoma sp. HMF4905]|uniref:Acyltransferase n=1 Tax=Spirosoma arboris TaxID=2682092 RepID=A0A7K1SFD1_9BACT|nr:acyltransferase [Spirosoma arboris]MVM32530.1 acyltransferase [Spirosoma arboris]